jgi:cytochrome c oxidase subunit IV
MLCLTRLETVVDARIERESQSGNLLPVMQTATAFAVSFAICTGSFLTNYFGIQGGILPAVTAIVVILETAFPRQFAYLAPSGEAMALILMQVTFHQPCTLSFQILL